LEKATVRHGDNSTPVTHFVGDEGDMSIVYYALPDNHPHRFDDYLYLRRQFAIRLRNRSFSLTKVESLFDKVDYSMRRSLLLSLKKVKSNSFKWFAPQVYCPSSVIINLKQIIKKNWEIFLLSRFFDPDTVFSTLPIISNVSDKSLGHIVNKINAKGYKKLV
jgi:hypothetical protein